MYRIADIDGCYDEAILRALDDIQKKVRSGIIQNTVVSISYEFNEDSELLGEIRRKIELMKEFTTKLLMATVHV